LCRNNHLEKFTEPVTLLTVLLCKGQITQQEYQEAQKHPGSIHKLAYFLGVPDIQVELHRYPLQPGDCILLCTNGMVWNVTDEEIKQTFQAYPLGDVAKHLIELSERQTTPYNVTLLVIAPDSVPSE